MAERESASRAREQILVALIEHDREHPQRILTHARALVARDPLNERGHIELISALAALGRGRDARAQHAQCCRIFEMELGLGPPAALDQALAALDACKAPVRDDSAAGAPVFAAQVVDVRRRAPLFGRDEEATQLAAAVDRAVKGLPPDVLLVSGVPGIGKSRLLDELEQQVAAAGGRTLRGRAFEAERLRPYGFWIDALRGAGDLDLPPALQAALRPLMQASVAGVQEGDRDRLFDAVRNALAQLAHAGPLAVLVDDLQWIEDSSSALLHYAIRQLADSPVLFVLSARSGELEDNASAQPLIATLVRDRRLRRIALGPLRDDDARSMVRSVAPQADAKRIVAQAQGHPLMLLELARSTNAPDASTAILEHILETRLSPLSPGAAELLGWASAFGCNFPLEGLIAAQGIELPSIDAALSELERHDLICATGNSGYAFSHDLIRQAAYRRISQPRRRLVHKAIALVLSRQMETDPACGVEVAHHAGLGAQHALAARASVCAGEHGLRVFANREAAELARRGRGHAMHIADKAQRARLEMALLSIQVLATSSQPLVRLRPEVQTIEQAIVGARTCRLHDEVAHGHYLLSIVHQEAGHIDAARQATLLAAETANRSDHLGRARQLANSARCLVDLGRDIGQARALVAEAQMLADSAGAHEIEVHWCRGLLHHWDGELEPALRHIDRAIALAAEEEDRWRQCKCLAAAAMIELERRAPEPALARAMALGQAASQLGDTADAPLAQVLSALARRMAGDEAAPLDAAIEALRAADDKSRLAGVLNMAAAIEWERKAFETAGAFAADALRMAESIGEANEALIANATLAQVAAVLSDPRRGAHTAQALRPALDAPAGFSARAAQAAADAIAYTERIQTARAGSAQ
ncbi:MAG: AAA family ATPase [Burkholderiales bacterium]